VTTQPISHRAARWLAGNVLTLADQQTAPVLTFFRAAAEGDTAIAECAPISARRECKSARPGITVARSPGE